MSTKRPLFSIVMPTRNRAHLLPNALRSALNQEFDDYEIVIVANDCQDNTREVVEAMATRRVRYFETDKMLSMPDNWEFAWTKAQGKYITYLSDDDALTPNALKFLAENALHDEPLVVTWEDAIYYYPNWSNENISNTLMLLFFGETIIEDIPSSLTLQKIADFDFTYNAALPKLLNCIVQHDHFETWRNKLGRLFFPTCPDFSFAFVALKICSTIRNVHKPLSVRGGNTESIGCSSASSGAALQTFLKEFGKFEFFKDTAYHLELTINHVAATFMRVNTAFEKINIMQTKLNLNALSLAIAKELINTRAMRSDWDELVINFMDQLQIICPELKDTITPMFAQTDTNTVKDKESIRDAHIRTQQTVLQNLLHINRGLIEQSGDIQSALNVLSLQHELMVDPEWSHMYIFGERLNLHNIYTISTRVEYYYDLLCRGKALCKNQLVENQSLASKLKQKVKEYIV